MPGCVCALPKRQNRLREKVKNRLARLLHVARGDTVASTKGGREIGGVLIARHPGRLLHAVPLQQIASGPRQPAIAQVIKNRTAVGLAKFTAQAAGAHRGPLGQLVQGVVVFRRLLQQAANSLRRSCSPPAGRICFALSSWHTLRPWPNSCRISPSSISCRETRPGALCWA